MQKFKMKDFGETRYCLGIRKHRIGERRWSMWSRANTMRFWKDTECQISNELQLHLRQKKIDGMKQRVRRNGNDVRSCHTSVWWDHWVTGSHILKSHMLHSLCSEKTQQELWWRIVEGSQNGAEKCHKPVSGVQRGRQELSRFWKFWMAHLLELFSNRQTSHYMKGLGAGYH
jgi:hypothetical protein